MRVFDLHSKHLEDFNFQVLTKSMAVITTGIVITGLKREMPGYGKSSAIAKSPGGWPVYNKWIVVW